MALAQHKAYLQEIPSGYTVSDVYAPNICCLRFYSKNVDFVPLKHCILGLAQKNFQVLDVFNVKLSGEHNGVEFF